MATQHHSTRLVTIILRPDDFRNPEVWEGFVEQIYYGHHVAIDPNELEITVSKCVAYVDK